jgi:3-dehydroquinate synthase
MLVKFYPPSTVHVDSAFLDTLQAKDVRSGIGEIAKVHAIEGREAFDRFAADVDAMLMDRAVLDGYVHAALRIKQRFIEADEFDTGIRNVFNYGHSFGHAIESATHYAVPHGIAVAMGMDAANALAVARGLTPREHYPRMHGVLRTLYGEYAAVPVAINEVIAALMADKKNTSGALGLILPVGPDARIERLLLERNDGLLAQVRTAVSGVFN